MALNPIVFTEKVVRSFLLYQLTAYPFADERLGRRPTWPFAIPFNRHPIQVNSGVFIGKRSKRPAWGTVYTRGTLGTENGPTISIQF